MNRAPECSIKVEPGENMTMESPFHSSWGLHSSQQLCPEPARDDIFIQKADIFLNNEERPSSLEPSVIVHIKEENMDGDHLFGGDCGEKGMFDGNDKGGILEAAGTDAFILNVGA